MGKIVKVTCDGCGHDLTTRSNSVDYRLVLCTESKPGYGAGAYTDMVIYPPVDRSYYFCGLGCLDHWRARENHQSGLWKAWSDDWKEKNYTSRRDDGRVLSYSSAPQELRDARKAEFEAAALAAFPLERPKRG
jgi:hypothetical protein